LNVADASVWVSALVPGDAHHVSSRAWLEREQAAERAVVAPALLLPEVAAAISRKTGRPALARSAIAAVMRLPHVRLVALDPDLAEAAGRLAADCALRGADAVYVAVAERLGIPLVTWDREQIERGGRVLEVVTPSADA
jgi:predicted nucleic acid-binding protein